VHNGVLANHEDVADELSLKLQTDCDSEVLLRLVETATSVPRGLQDCLRLVKGSMAIAVFDKATGFVWLAQNGGRPLWLARLKKDRRWFFASTQRILLDGIGSVVRKPGFDFLIPAPEGIPLALTPDGRFIAVDSG
jgi:glutamine phosphoribosylpyrophosphate amidotransferase